MWIPTYLHDDLGDFFHRFSHVDMLCYVVCVKEKKSEKKCERETCDECN